MVNILAHIIGWIFIAMLALGFLGLIIYLIELIRYAISSKEGSCGPLPWWVFWRP